MTTYNIASIKGTQTVNGTLAEAIAAAKRHDEKLRPAYGTQVTGEDGETVWDSEDTIDAADEENANSKAFQSGLEDGAEQVRDLTRGIGQEPLSGEALVEQVESWFAPGTLEPDEGLINALDDRCIARPLGLTEEQVKERGDDWSKALDDYNRGYRTGARREAAAEIDAAAEQVEAGSIGLCVGDRVRAGKGEDADAGEVQEVDGDEATIAWDSGVRTKGPMRMLELE